MAALTVTQSGNLSNPATFGGTTFANGDTITCGAFTLTIDVNCSIGTSPNNATARSLDKTSATGSIIVASGVTLTMLGNIGMVNGATFTMQAGSTLTFDASASGGTPTYTFLNVGFSVLNFNGTSSARCTVQAVSGRIGAINVPTSDWTATFTDFRRINSFMTMNNVANCTHTDNTHDSCGRLTASNTSIATAVCIVERNVCTNGTHSTDDFYFNYSVDNTSGTRRFTQNSLSKAVTYLGKTFEVRKNTVLGGWINAAGATVAHFRENFVSQNGSLNGGNGALFPFSITRNYMVVENSTGNPHWIAPTALLGSDNIVSQCVFENQTPDLVDSGDCVILNAGATSGGNKVFTRNCVVLPGAGGVGSQLLTLYANATSVCGFDRNTVAAGDSAVAGKRAAFAFAEAGSGAANQIESLKSNVVYTASGTGGYLAERISGTVTGHITPAGANRNRRWNLSAGDNGRGYEDRANSPGLDLWAGGVADGNDAAAANVDDNSTTGDPQFVDATRTAAAWCAARGYGAATYVDAKTALLAEPTRIPDLIDYVFAGFEAQDATMRAASHDGMCVGAANFNDTTRTGAGIGKVRAFLVA